MAATRLLGSSQSTEPSILRPGPCTKAASQEKQDRVERKRLRPYGSPVALPPFQPSDAEIFRPMFPVRLPMREDVAPTGWRGHLAPRSAIAQNPSQQLSPQAATPPAAR